MRSVAKSWPSLKFCAIPFNRRTPPKRTWARPAHEQEKAALALNKAAIGYQELARQAETDRALYESVLRQIKDTNLTKDVKTNAVSVIEHSPYPYSPVSPNPRKAILLGLLGGLAVALAFVYSRRCSGSFY